MGDINFTFDVPRGGERFRELIIYVSNKCADDDTFGSTKLNKILFYADFRAYERLGTPLTGMAYFRLERGPAPEAIVKVRRDLQKEGALALVERALGNYVQKRPVARREAFVDAFSVSELAIVDEVIEELAGKSATAVSDESHGVAWHSLRDRERIPYEAVFLSDEKATQADIAEARALNDKYQWGLRV